MNTERFKNLHNLHAYWLALGANQTNELFKHQSWPNKTWVSDFSLPKEAQTLMSDKGVFSTAENELNLNHMKVKSQLVMMNLSFTDRNFEAQKSDSDNSIVKIYTVEQAQEWAVACGSAFGYGIDSAVIEQLITDHQATIYAYVIDGNIAGTAIGYHTGDTLGIHQLGTVPDYRKRGVADALMQQLLNLAKESGCITVSLQASQAGLHLYERLGFKALGHLTSLVGSKD